MLFEVFHTIYVCIYVRCSFCKSALISFFLALNYDLESSHLTSVSSQSSGKDVQKTGLKQKAVTAKDVSSSSSTAIITKNSKTTIITNETGKKLVATEGSVQVMDKSADKQEEDVFE